ncbi:MAG: Dabb family protein [Geitlerinemataceae cyanobacterium]
MGSPLVARSEDLPPAQSSAISPPIHHIVLIDLHDETTDEEVRALIDDGEATIAAIPGVEVVDMGLQALGDRAVHINDYDLAVYIQFASLDALAAYGPHPDHQAFLARHRHLWSGIRVIDFFGSIDAIEPAPSPDEAQ